MRTGTTTATSAEQAALDALDPQTVVASLMHLISVPSVGGSDEESQVQHLIADSLHELDLDVDLWQLELDALGNLPGFPGVEAQRDEAWGLVATTEGESAVPALILQGHVDVVPPGDLGAWRGDPFRPAIIGDSVHGRGACDMKSGVVANIAALTAIRKAGLTLRDRLALHFAVGEEDGGLGAFATVTRGHTGDACIITEPTSGTVTTANAGALTFTIEVAGRATHASTAYAGSSAIDSYLLVHQALAELQRERNRLVDPLMREYPVAYPISVGTVRAGDWASSVPDRLVAEGRLGIGIDEDPASARLALETRIIDVAARSPFLRDHPPVVTWTGGQFAGGRTTPGHPIVDVVRDAHADATGGSRPRERGVPYGSDLRLYQAADVPTVHYGPGDVRLAHGPRESVPVAEVLDVTRTLILTILRTCGTV